MSYAVNGARPTMMDTIIDGVTASFPTVNGVTGISVFPSVDAIQENSDLSLFKNLVIRTGTLLQVRIEALNTFNRVQFSAPNISVTSSSFGVISGQANAPRQLQFGAKLSW